MKKDARIVLIERGLCGCMIEWSDSTSGSGYPRDFDRTLAHLRKHGDACHDPEGVVVLDKTEPLERNPKLAVSSPMLRGDLAPDEHRPFDSRLLYRQFGSEMCRQFAGGGGAAAAAVAAGFIGGLDDVGLDVFVAWWRERGARVGRVVNGQVRWQDG